MKLPQEFYDCMRQTLGEDYERFAAELSEPPYRGLRINEARCSAAKAGQLLGLPLQPTPFCEQGYYISNEVQGLGNHPLHHAGGFYLQEPSAMSAVTALCVQQGERVLDLCAAPGGKATQIAAALAGSGLLWANEIVPSRAQVLCSNLERMGIENAVASCAPPELLCEELAGFFDRVLVDAPCSGEGMLRREPNAVALWRIENRAACALRDEKILDSAARALRAGGYLVYSTCTLSGEENEQTIAAFLRRHAEFSIEHIAADFGRAAYTRLCEDERLARARRILPADGGEGHFIALLRKNDGEPAAPPPYEYRPDRSAPFLRFFEQCFGGECKNPERLGESIMLLPDGLPKTRRVHILKAGVAAGRVKGERFEPSHELYMARQSRHTLPLCDDDPRIREFLRGSEIECGSEYSGYVGVLYEGIPCGFGKASGGRLKNHYPKGLRVVGR